MNGRASLPFLPEWREAMLLGRKTATTRRRPHATVGDTFEVFGRTFRVVAVAPMTLRDVHDFWWREEGVESPADYRLVWMRLHPRRGYVGTDRVYLHLFRIMESPRLNVEGRA